MSGSMTIDVSDAMKRIDPAQLEKYITAALHGAMDLLRNELKEYPAPPAGSTYHRTRKLGQGWAKSVVQMSSKPSSIVAKIGPHVPYARWVQDEDKQAKVHRGRWQTVQSVARSKENEVKRFVETALRKWAG